MKKISILKANDVSGFTKKTYPARTHLKKTYKDN